MACPTHMIEPIAENSITASSLVTRQLALTASFARLTGVASSVPAEAAALPTVPPYSAPIPSASALLDMDNQARALAVTFYAARLIVSDASSELGGLASRGINILA